MRRYLITVVFVLSVSGTALGQAIELNAGWTVPTNDLGDLADGGPGGNATLTYPLGEMIDLSARVGFYDHRGMTFNLPEGVEGIPAGNITAREIPVVGGVRITVPDRRYYVEIQAGGVLKYLRLGALGESSEVFDPVMLLNAGATIWNGFGLSASYTYARYEWRHFSGGLMYRIPF